MPLLPLTRGLEDQLTWASVSLGLLIQNRPLPGGGLLKERNCLYASTFLLFSISVPLSPSWCSTLLPQSTLLQMHILPLQKAVQDKPFFP